MKKILALFMFMSINCAFCQTNIFDVCRSGNIKDIIAYYTKNPDCVNKTTKEGYSPLILACYYGNVEAVRFLLDKVDDINGVSDYGTPLMAAVVKGNVDIVAMLLDKQADVNIPDANGTTALHYAVMFKNYSIVKLLMEAHADTTLRDNRGKTPMDYAQIYDDRKLTNLLK